MSTSQRVAALGQSLWLDNLSRSLIHDGTLAKLIAEDGVSGVTSNPSIFQSALATGHSTIQRPSSPTAMGRSGIAVYVQRLVGLVEHRFTAPRQVA